jgi:hypothetical protein
MIVTVTGRHLFAGRPRSYSGMVKVRGRLQLSAFPPIATTERTSWDVSNVPIAVMGPVSSSDSRRRGFLTAGQRSQHLVAGLHVAEDRIKVSKRRIVLGICPCRQTHGCENVDLTAIQRVG